jgi:hypothetical protein
MGAAARKGNMAYEKEYVEREENMVESSEVPTPNTFNFC